MAGLFSLFKGRAKEPPMCSAVVAAAGSARRMEGVDKVLAPLGELPVLVHTLYALQDCPDISEVIVVTREDLLVETGRLCRQYGLDKVKKVVVGGKERLHSVQAGLREVSREAAVIAIHDGARPLASAGLISQVVQCALRTGAAAPALPLTDTVKRVEEELAVETVDRSALRAVQTPQVFDADLIRAAVQKALDDGEALTDDCGAVERMGMKVSLVPGSRENLKLTTPIDFLIAEAILEARGRGEL
ncbi:MAG: 2-C-methyl-D-erythritol 4-phosphate cytidylyltransferase [Lawsonibacter sp.]|nr:2-C-methyl-D-erythritol 4-phosphate cytidylyltransferase [Lawsonibacter sp.]